MASVGRLVGRAFRPLVLQRITGNTTLTRSYATAWNKDWKPGPYPVTPEERAAAAKKYGLRPEDYEPYPDDGDGYGDYPKLPHVAPDTRDPYVDWDQPDLKRNYGEPLHVDTDKMVEDKWSANYRYRYSWFTMWGMLIGVLTLIGGAYYLTLPYPHFHPAMKKQYAKEGPHYTFEPVEE